MHKLSIILLFQILVFQSVFSEKIETKTKPLSPTDFVYNATLSDANTSLRKVTLPLSVYENMQRSDYGDLRVFSAQGQVVPHQILSVTSVQTTQETMLRFYPFSKQQAANPSNIRVIIDQGTGRQHLDIQQTIRESKTSGSNAIGSSHNVKQNEYQYIIENLVHDNDSRKRYLCKLKLEWEQSKPSMILPLSLQSSDDLRSWKSLGRSLNVSSLSYAGEQLSHKEINFSCTSHKYLRLIWLKPSQQTHLSKVSGFYTQNGAQKIQWKSFTQPDYDAEGNWLFESDVIAALSHMEFIAPEENSLYKGKLYSRNNKESAWQFRKNIIQYRLLVATRNGKGDVSSTELKSTAFTHKPNSDRYWKLELANASETHLNKDQFPIIRGGWQQQELIFLAQGKPPFQLAYGNPNIKLSENTGLKQLIRTFEDSGIIPEKVSVGKAQKMNKLAEPENRIPWKRAGLWFLLLSGTALLGFMALSLYRQMDEK